jgi:hypothetical protein
LGGLPRFLRQGGPQGELCGGSARYAAHGTAAGGLPVADSSYRARRLCSGMMLERRLVRADVADARDHDHDPSVCPSGKGHMSLPEPPGFEVTTESWSTRSWTMVKVKSVTARNAAASAPVAVTDASAPAISPTSSSPIKKAPVSPASIPRVARHDGRANTNCAVSGNSLPICCPSPDHVIGWALS